MFAAASLTEAFNALLVPGLDITFNFAGSGTLVTQLQQGASADVVATADPASMRTLTDANLVDDQGFFARNRLEIIVAAGNPKGIESLADLARPDVTVVLADQSVPAGKYAQQALAKAAVTVAPKSLEVDVKSVVARVTADEADAGIVYATDVLAAGAQAKGVVIPDAENVIAEYPIAIVRAAPHPAAARAFVDAVLTGAGRDILRQKGFTVP